VVPFHGEAKAREVIQKFELSHENKAPGTTGAKFHVLVTSYNCVNNAKDFTSVFKKQPRWEVLVVDEGQRCKILRFPSMSAHRHSRYRNSEKRHQFTVQEAERIEDHASDNYDWGKMLF
jgi:SNF2 family DNA or RNA helicase